MDRLKVKQKDGAYAKIVVAEAKDGSKANTSVVVVFVMSLRKAQVLVRFLLEFSSTVI